TAGQVPTRRVTAGYATAIMTGAPIPDGANAVVMVERTEPLAAAGVRRVRIHDPALRPGQNIRRRASSMRAGDTVFSAGRTLRPIESGLLAEVGRTEVMVARRPRVAVLSTGNELVAGAAKPGAGQIRNSNGPLLVALVQRAGGEAVSLGIARDDEG